MDAAITSLGLTDVRTIAETQHAKLSKVTLLVGENSVGKSTFMGCLNAIGQLANLHRVADDYNFFNVDPFMMGGFDSIARTGCQSFQVSTGLGIGPFSKFGLSFQKGGASSLRESRLNVQLATSGSRPKISIIREAQEHQRECWRFIGGDFEFRVDHADVSDDQFTSWLHNSVARGILPFQGDRTTYQKRMPRSTHDDLVAFAKFVNFFRHQFRFPGAGNSIVPIAPSSLTIKRIYDKHPIQALKGYTDLESISEAGRPLGLFQRINVQQIADDQFKVLVNVSGSLHNIASVGRGIASLIPLLTALSNASDGSLFLLQQPEVNVHPSAQAQLVEMMSRSSHAFVIETHSDHVMNRLRIMVRDEVLAPSDVSIIFFEPRPEDRSATRLHQISLDHLGNVLDAPPSYRQFFLKETNRVLGFTAGD